MQHKRLNNISELINQTDSYITERINYLNQNNSNLYTILLDGQKQLNNSIKKLSSISDMLLDIQLLKSLSKNKINVTGLPIHSKENIALTNNKIELELKNKNVHEVISAESTVRSIQVYNVKNLNSEKTTLNNIFQFKTETILEFNNESYSCDFVLQYRDFKYINSFKIDLGKNFINLPSISKIEYKDLQGHLIQIPFEIKNLNAELNKNNSYEYIIDTVYTDTFIITFSNTNTNKLYIKSVETSFKQYAETGYIIFGPYVSSYPILKTSISMLNYSNNYDLQISKDLSEWIAMEPTNSINFNNKNKVASFNTINDKSFKSSEDIKTLYIKLSLNSIEKEFKDEKNLLTLKKDNLYPEDVVEENKFSAYSEKPSATIYGKSKIYKNINEIDLLNLENIKINNTNKFLSMLSTSPYNINFSSSNEVDASFKFKKEGNNIIFCNTYDISSIEVYDINIEKITTNNYNIALVLPLKVPEDIYTIKSNNKQLILDCRQEFISNSSLLTILVPNEDINIFNSLGKLHLQIKKENLEKIVIENIEYSYVNLYDIFYNSLDIKYLTYNPFPSLINNINTYYIEDNKLIINTNKVLVDSFDCFILNRIKKPHSKHVSYTNKNYIKINNSEINYHFTETIPNVEFNNQIKLSKTFIKKGSIEITTDTEQTNQLYTPDTSEKRTYINAGTEKNPMFIVAENDVDNEIIYYLKD